MTLKRRYDALIKVLVDNRVRIEWMRSTRIRIGNGVLVIVIVEIRGIARQGKADLYIKRKQKTRPRVNIPGKGQGVKEVAPDSELTSVLAIVGHVLIS